jgi:predicted phosphohydrolase
VILQPFSDAHSDCAGFSGFPPLIEGVDAIVVAGDTRQGLAASLTELRAAYPRPVEILMVAGNHEFWGSVWSREVDEGRRVAEKLGIRFMEDQAVTLGRLRVLGCTLWTSYDAYGESLRPAAMRSAREEMRDHKRIKWSSDPWRRFRPEEARMLHMRSRAFIEEELSKPHDGPTLVITHAAVSIECIPPSKQKSIVSAAYFSEMLPVIDRHQPDLWVFGHTHHRTDFRRGKTRILSNPIGYADERTGFDPTLTVAIDGERR